jgi:hypothetical protein
VGGQDTQPGGSSGEEGEEEETGRGKRGGQAEGEEGERQNIGMETWKPGVLEPWRLGDLGTSSGTLELHGGAGEQEGKTPPKAEIRTEICSLLLP